MDLPLSLRAPLKHCFLYLTVMCSMMDLVVAQGMTYKQLYSQIWSQPPSFSPPGQSFSPPGPPQSLPVASFSDQRDFNSLIAGGMNIDQMPKSALAVQTRDGDYTRLRQLFLRDMCQRMLSSDRAATFTFCIGILALSPI